MTTIVIKPKNKAEKIFLTRLLKKMNIETQFIEEPIPNYETQKAIKDAESGHVTIATSVDELFDSI